MKKLLLVCLGFIYCTFALSGTGNCGCNDDSEVVKIKADLCSQISNKAQHDSCLLKIAES